MACASGYLPEGCKVNLSKIFEIEHGTEIEHGWDVMLEAW